VAAEEWKRRILEIDSERAVRFEEWSAMLPPSPTGYDVVPRVIRTEFVSEWQGRPAEAREHAERLRAEVMASVERERPDELTPFTGQSAGLIHDVLPAAEIVRRMVAGAEEALDRAAALRFS
jgi:nitronate monooxygenase/enoyl-[acyl-carrier protein] reductase II